MESLRKHWALILVIAIAAIGYRLWVSSDPYIYHSVGGATFRVNKETGVREYSGSHGWTH